MTKLFLNADDFGASKAINQGIKLAIKARKVTSVSVMVTMPYFQDAVRFLKKHPEVKVGLHFNLTEGKKYHSLAYTLWSLLTGRASLSQVEQELKVQYQQLKKTGLPIDHLDTHQHLHLFPPLYKLLRDFCLQEKIPRLRGCHFSWNQGLRVVASSPSFKQVAIWTLFGVNDFLYPQKKRQSSTHLVDLNWLSSFTQNTVSQLLSSMPTQGTTEVICHLSARVTRHPLSRARVKCLSYLLNHFDTIR